MEFVRCDRCKKEIPYKESWTRLDVSTLHRNGLGKTVTTSNLEVDLCKDCAEGLYVYLQRKVESYADLVKM